MRDLVFKTQAGVEIARYTTDLGNNVTEGNFTVLKVTGLTDENAKKYGLFFNIGAYSVQEFKEQATEVSRLALTIEDNAGSTSVAAKEDLSINPLDLEVGIIDEAYNLEGVYSVFFTARGGELPYVWSLDESSDELPGDFSLNAVTGELHGLTGEVGEYALVIKVTDAATTSKTIAATLTIEEE